MRRMSETATGDPAGIAARASEAIRELCYATRVTSPADMSVVLGALETMAEQVPLICGQLAAWLDDEAEGNTLLATDGSLTGDVPAAVTTAIQWLHQAAGLAEKLRLALANAHRAVEGLARGASEDLV
jgi:hypothetical protein